jgi:tungstate transport system substrate-binding protein
VRGPDRNNRPMISRRHLLSMPLATLLPASALHAQQRRSLADPMRLGVDTALFDAGLAKALQQGFGRDTGVAVKLVSAPALPLLDALDRGEFDAALTNVPEAEIRREQQGLAHDRQAIATGDFVLVGPAPHGKVKDPAGIKGMASVTDALIQLRNAALALPDAVMFTSAADGSGTHVLEQALWRTAKLGPAAPWYVAADARSGLIAQARERGTYALVERGAWAALGGAPLAVLVEGDPQLIEAVHVMRAFRVSHPAGKLFVAWIAGPKGQRVVAAHRGYRIG